MTRSATLNPTIIMQRLLLRALLLVLFTFTAAQVMWSAPQDLRQFDDFIHHVRQEAASGDAERIFDCFAPLVVAESGCAAVSASDALSYDAQRFGWKALGRDVARFADGFVLVHADGTMTNLHARAAGRQRLLEVTGNRIKLRREAGAKGEVIAMLDEGTFLGSEDPARWKVERDGIEWTPVIIEVPNIGKVKGYVGSDYVRSVKGHGDLKLTAQFDGERWALTGYERTRSDLELNCAHPTP